MQTYREAMIAAHDAYIDKVMKLAGGVVSKAAVIAGKNRTDMYKLVMKSPRNFKLEYRCRVNKGNAEWQRLGS
jgi:hypothetical protein